MFAPATKLDRVNATEPPPLSHRVKGETAPNPRATRAEGVGKKAGFWKGRNGRALLPQPQTRWMQRQGLKFREKTWREVKTVLKDRNSHPEPKAESSRAEQSIHQWKDGIIYF